MNQPRVFHCIHGEVCFLMRIFGIACYGTVFRTQRAKLSSFKGVGRLVAYADYSVLIWAIELASSDIGNDTSDQPTIEIWLGVCNTDAKI